MGYLMCFDLNAADGKPLNNFCKIALQAFCNIFATQHGKDFLQDPEQTQVLLSFASSSLQAKNPKLALNAAVLGFNAMLCFKGDKKKLS